MSENTQELLDILTCETSIENYYKTFDHDLQQTSISNCLENLLAKKKMTKATVIKHSGLDRTYGYQLFNGTRKPSRDTLICLGIGMKLTLDELQDTLKLACFSPLHTKDERDQAIILFLNNHKTVFDLEQFLSKQNLTGILRIEFSSHKER